MNLSRIVWNPLYYHAVGREGVVLLLVFTLFALIGCLSTTILPETQSTSQPQTSSPLFAWTPHNIGLQTSFQVTAIAVDPLEPTHLVAALYHPIGLLESWDSGRS